MPKRKAFITGITGQDGSYLAEILLEKDYEVYGMVRRSSTFNRSRIDHLYGRLELVYGDLGDGSALNQLNQDQKRQAERNEIERESEQHVVTKNVSVERGVAFDRIALAAGKEPDTFDISRAQKAGREIGIVLGALE